MSQDPKKIAEQSKGLWAEFKEFISRGSVIDLAVGMIIGAAFTAIVSSLVNDVVMPLIGVIIGGIDFSGIQTQVGGATIMWGNFIQAIINFLLIALVVFLMVKAINTAHDVMTKKNVEELEEATAEPTPEDKQLQLLAEIRDAPVNREQFAERHLQTEACLPKGRMCLCLRHSLATGRPTGIAAWPLVSVKD